ncbi:MAG: glycosyltransferase family 2 protein [Patescibacteria group bacterium]|nr:glycosyltransferase family 2 protein [Patescibacteria group bacterium]
MNKDYWIKKNWYYHKYIRLFVDFVVSQDKKIFEVKSNDLNFKHISNNFDYVVASDVLGGVADVQRFFEKVSDIIVDDGRVVITQYNALWEPILALASKLRLRRPMSDQNWLSKQDIINFAYLAGLEAVKSGTKMLMPKYIPVISAFLNRFVSNIFPFSRLGIFHYLVFRKKVSLLNLKSPSISIIVPARNEAGTIKKIVKELPKLGSFTEIIFIEGHSTDNTLEEIKKYATSGKIKYAVQDGKGKGDAVRKGFDMAQGDILAIYDADMTVPVEEVSKFYEAISTNKADFINGSRLIYPMEKESMRILNIFGNKFFSFAFSSIFGQPIKDTLCGTKVLWKKDYENIKKNRAFFGDFDPFGDFDLLLGAVKQNLKIIDMPVHYKERKYGVTNISRWKHGWLLLKMTIFAARKIKFI